MPLLQKAIRARGIQPLLKNFLNGIKFLPLLFLFTFIVNNNSFGQTAIPNTTAVTQNFDGMAATTTLPSNWRMRASTASPTWSGASATVTQQASSGSPSAGGTYNFGSSASERAVGAMTSGGFASPNNLLGFFQNTNAGNLTSLTIAYDGERYRRNTAAASVQFYYSLNGTSWTAVAAGDIATSEFPTGTSTYTMASPLVVAKSGISITGLNIATNGTFYLRWNVNTTGANSQGIAIDNISVTAGFAAASTISTTGSLSALSTTYGTVSSASTVSVSGTGLTADITATAPTGFEVSNGGSYATTTTFAQSGGTASGTLSVRIKADAAVTGTYNSQNIVLSSTGATNVNVTTAASGNSVTAAALTITGVSSTNKIYNATAIGSLTGTASYVGLQNSESFSVTGTPVATFAQSTVGTGIGVTVTGYTAPSTNYTVSQPSVSNADITAKPITISGLTANNKVFDNTTTATLSGTATLVGVETADISNVTLGGAYVADFASAAVGTGIAVTVTGYSLSGSAAGNYSLTQPSSLTADITASAVPTITGAATATAFTTTYGSPSTAQNFSVSGVDLTDDITATAPTGFEVSNGGAYGPTTTFTQTGGSASGTLSVRLKADAAVTGSYNSLNIVLSSTGAVDKNITTSASGNTVSAAALTVSGITASNKVYDGNSTASLNTGSAAYVGLVNAESFSVTGTITGTFANKNVGTGKTVTIAGVDAPSTNYTVTQPTTTADITVAPLTITSPAVTTKLYDGNTNATITGTLSGIISPDVVTLVGTGTFASSAVGTGISVTSTSTLAGADAGNYEINPQPSGLTGTITASPVLYNFGTTTGTSAPTSGTIANLTFGNVTTGNSVNPSVSNTNTTSASTGYTGSTGNFNYAIVTQRGAAFSTSTAAYYEVTITPASGYNVNLNSLSFGFRSTGSGATNIEIYTSANNFGSSISSYTVSNNSTWTLSTPSFSTVTSASALTIRIFGYNPSGATLANNSAANFRIDDLSINADGTLTPPPTASVLSGTASICAGSSTNLSVAVTGGASPYTVVVSDGGSNTYTATSASPVTIPVTPSSTSTFTIVSVTDFNNGVGTGNTGSAVVTVNPIIIPTTAASYTSTLNHTDGATLNYADASCNLLANLSDVAGGNTLGSTQIDLSLGSAILVANNNIGYVRRTYTVTPSSAGSATLTMYFTQADFDNFNSSNGTQKDIASGSGDATGIANIKVKLATGGTINTGSLTDLTPSVSWNATDSRWEVSVTSSTWGNLYVYADPTCLTAVTGISSTAITPTTATVNWDNAGVSTYTFRFRVQGNTTWSSSVSNTNSRSLLGLAPNTTYEVQIRAICGPSSFGAYYQSTFTTQSSPCDLPSGFGQNSVTATSATITWNSVAAANGYSIRFKPNSGSVWNNTSSATNSRTFNGLTPNTLYDVEVRTNCTNLSSAYAAYQFTSASSGCTSVSNISSTSITTSSATLNWDNVATALSYSIRIKPNSSNVWNNTSSATNTRVFNGLQANTLYDVQIRTNCSGEASNYIATQFTTATSTCTVPTNITHNSATLTSSFATINWNAVQSATYYVIRFRVQNTMNWSYTTASSNTRSFAGLTPSTSYEVQILSSCAGQGSAYSDSYVFTTNASMKTNPMTETASISQFNGKSTSKGHELSWFTNSENACSSFEVLHSTDGQTFNPLAKVATKANNGTSEETLGYDYLHTTPSAGANYYRLEMVAIDGSQTLYNQLVRLDQNSIQHQVTVTPNPTRDIVKVTFMSSTTQQTSIKVMDMTGRVVKVVQATSQEGMNTLDVNLNELAAGMYTLHLLENNKLTHISKIQKQD